MSNGFQRLLHILEFRPKSVSDFYIKVTFQKLSTEKKIEKVSRLNIHYSHDKK